MIVTQLGGSLLFLTRRYCWLGAGILAGFTVMATLLAHPFWAFEGPDRGRQTATFFEHVAIVGGLAMAALFVNGRSAHPMTAPQNTAAEGKALPPPPGTFAPLRHRLFAVIWAATVLGNIGTFMRDVASAWLVTDLSASPAAVAMIQAAGTLPVFLLAIPAGVLSDILDRRRFLIGIQIGLGIVSTALAFLAWTGTVSVVSLVALTFLGGVGAALAAPAWQSIVPELVPRPTSRGPWRSTRSASTSPAPSARRSAASCSPPSEPPPSTGSTFSAMWS